MISEIITIIGFTIIFSLALINVYFLKYAERFFKDPEEFQQSHTMFLIILFALILHSLYHFSEHFGLPYGPIFEITSVYLIVAVMAKATKHALYLEISAEIKKERKVRELMEYRAIQSRLGDTSKELVETKNFFNNIIQSSADAIVASGIDKKITYFSKGAEELFEIKASDVIGHNVLDLYPKEFLRKKDRMDRARELKEKGYIKNMTLKISTPSNKFKSISLSISSLMGEDKKIKGTVGVAKDITDEVRAANEIRQLKELSDKILEGMPEGLLLLDLKFRIARVNKSFVRITGIEKKEIAGKNILEYMKIPVAEKLFEAMNLKKKFSYVAFNEKTIKPEEFTFNLDGEEKTLTDYWTPVFDREGRVEFVLIILQEITLRKELEKSLMEQAEQLQKSNELKDIFTDIMRHDILNPIGVIKNYAEIITLEDINPLVKRSVDAISRNVEKTVEMIDAASKLEKIESVEQIDFETLDLGVLLRDAVENTTVRAAEKGMKIIMESEGSYPATVSSFIGAVFLNLLTNAIKYSPENTEIRVGVIDLDTAWKVYVKDRGEGISDRYKETIFTRFERLQKEGVKGTGLGLAIVKRIVEIHSGNVWVEDNPGGGSVFYVELPKEFK